MRDCNLGLGCVDIASVDDIFDIALHSESFSSTCGPINKDSAILTV